jgi:hypothetical protein
MIVVRIDHHYLRVKHHSRMLRNEDGNFMKAMDRHLPSMASALAAEAEAWRDGLRFLGLSGHHQVILESDSMELIALWRSPDEQHSQITPILREVHAMTRGLSYFHNSAYDALG